MFPAEDDFLSRNDFAILPLDRLLLAIASDQIPTKLSAYPRFSEDVTCLDTFRSEPLLQLPWVDPGLEHTRTRGVNEAFYLERCFACFSNHDFSFSGFSTNCLSSESTIAVHPFSKFFRAYAGVFGNVSMPVWVSLSRVLSPSGESSNVTNESPGSPL